MPEEGRLESFSGLFAPCEIDVSVKPEDCVVGTVVEVDLEVRSNAPHGFLDLPDDTGAVAQIDKRNALHSVDETLTVKLIPDVCWNL